MSAAVRGAFQPSLSPVSVLRQVERSLPIRLALNSDSPRYALLAFGTQAQSQVSLVLDGDRLLVVRGVQVEERLFTEFPGDCRWRECLIGDIEGGRHREMKLVLATDLTLLTLRGEGWGLLDLCYVVVNLKFADRVEESPIVHFAGPLVMHAAIGKIDGVMKVIAEVGTAGLGDGSFASISHSIAEQVLPAPVAEVAFTASDGSPQFQRILLGYDS
jgi:hypothetical protein